MAPRTTQGLQEPPWDSTRRDGGARKPDSVDVTFDKGLVNEREFRWTGLAPWEFELPFPGSLTSTCLESLVNPCTCGDRILDGLASGRKGSKGAPDIYCHSRTWMSITKWKRSHGTAQKLEIEKMQTLKSNDKLRSENKSEPNNYKLKNDLQAKPENQTRPTPQK